ncbi:hypothetical protein ASPVEDRAFT_219720 [Aspergillus versicolor CBS 583.65]|uniref:Chitin-binding type-1 domain-containing protein n=1 Tax=Aspergillus versicolor CBS 583.65 TaxID=1036611 RepID=A0A1L9P3Q5_ASPVE|nr:uncharacterized protein ASPVEDRAFT_219720 [Aspergillus versicolor CBS 583.65]OJI96128.1 hypothetical protein ASPVEDRAFT_219720 [Aspergillus versicolor CBS 583.65]
MNNALKVTITSLALVFLLQPLHAKPFHTLDTSAHLAPRNVSSTCKASVSTDIWTTCQSLIQQYNISLPAFYEMNPEVWYDCSQFHPGEDYCIREMTSFPISEDGLCGSQAAETVTCIGSEFGDCCGRNGTCGSTDNECAIGFCQSGICPGLGYSTNGTCGEEYGNLMCGGSFGDCCSNSGECGSTEAHCGLENCQSGACEGSTTSTTTPTSTPTPLPEPFSPSPDGTCGYRNKYVCNGTEIYWGYCCSAAGYCGTSQYHCSDLQGCQPEFGLCDVTNTVTASTGASEPTTTL